MIPSASITAGNNVNANIQASLAPEPPVPRKSAARVPPSSARTPSLPNDPKERSKHLVRNNMTTMYMKAETNHQNLFILVYYL